MLRPWVGLGVVQTAFDAVCSLLGCRAHVFAVRWSFIGSGEEAEARAEGQLQGAGQVQVPRVFGDAGARVWPLHRPHGRCAFSAMQQRRCLIVLRLFLVFRGFT